jgi:hypothetical protein
MLLHLPSQIEEFRARWPVLSDLPRGELATLPRGAAGSPGLGYDRPGEVDAIVSVIAWSVLGWARSRTPRAQMRGIRREANKRHLRPEVTEALARFLSGRLDEELAGRA